MLDTPGDSRSVDSEFEARSGSPSSASRLGLRRWIWIAFTLIYGVFIYFRVQRPFWYDELLTFYIAQARTAHDTLNLIYRFDFTPPPTFFLTRVSISLFGTGLFATRLPSIIEFYIGSAVLFAYVRRKTGTAVAACSLAVVWYSPVFYYATEARPYALMLTCFLCLLFFREIAISRKRRSIALWGMGLSNVAFLASHAFAVFSLLPFFIAECVRFYRRRKPDYAQWLALLLPLFVLLSYIPQFGVYRPILYPARFEASLSKLAHFFIGVFIGMGPGFAVAFFVALSAAALKKAPRIRRFKLRWSDLALFAALLAVPAVLIVILKILRVAFWDRYCICTAVGLLVALTAFVAYRLRLNRPALLASAAAFLLVAVVQNVLAPTLRARHNDPSSLMKVRPNLPLVAASPLTFLEMDHQEGWVMGKRLYYLQNRAAAVRYSHATLFEDFEAPIKMKNYLPIRGSVEQYDTFIREHPDFLVLGSTEYPEDWLLRKLADDGAKVIWRGDYQLPYKDSTLYEIQFESGK